MQVPVIHARRVPLWIPTAPEIRANRSGSFAWEVLHSRHPALIAHMLKALPYPANVRTRLDALRKELAEGLIQHLPELAHDRSAWDEWGHAYFGLPWKDAPSLWAESYFHRRLLDAVHYFEPGPWYFIDPFSDLKRVELRDDSLPGNLRTLARLPIAERTTALLLAILWGNQFDLGFLLGMEAMSGQVNALDRMVVDDTAKVRDRLHKGTPHRICIVADNAGQELLIDLAFVDHLLTENIASQVTLHVKPYPHFVSDAVPVDVINCLHALNTAGPPAQEVGHRLWDAIRDSRLTIFAHWFFCSPHSMHYLPEELVETYSTASLTIFKGDLNYRRLVGDCYWSPETDFGSVTSYFPGPIAALRVLKSEVVVGADPTTVSELQTRDKCWRTSGHFGMVQSRL
jgi:hypothetical protein